MLQCEKRGWMILAGDIGGTHTRLAFFEKGRPVGEERKFLSQNYESLSTIAQEFLSSQLFSVRKACFGIAGPVRQGVCKATNLPWRVDAAVLKQQLGLDSVALLNDLEANAYGIAALNPQDLFLVQKGNPHQSGNRALISAGTGLGEAGLFWDGKKHHPFACEGGHADFAARDPEEWALFVYLKERFPHVSYERVISGPGLASIYSFLVDTKRKEPAPLPSLDAKLISAWGKENRHPTCAYALDWFLSLYGSEAGNAALKFLALGGCYIGGGIAPHLKERFLQSDFLASFSDKGRFKELLQSIPIWVILNDDTALLGAAAFGELL